MITIVSFGYRHGPAPQADLTIDMRRLLHDPHVDPTLRNLTGLDEAVRERVLATPGAHVWAVYTAATVHVVADSCRRDVTVAIGCSGGRHRSVALAEQVAEMLSQAGQPAHVEHPDIDKPVLPPLNGSEDSHVPVKS